MEIFEQNPQQWTDIPPDRPSRPSPVWLLFATIIGALIGGAIVYFTVDTSPGNTTSAANPAVSVTTTTPVDTASTTIAPGGGESAVDIASRATYPIKGSATGFITLVDGSADEPIPGSASQLRVRIAKVTAADLDTDGTKDAVVILSVNTGGAGSTDYAYGVFADPKGTIVTDGVPLGDRIAIDKVATDPTTGTVTIHYRDHSDLVASTDPPDLLVVADLQILRTGVQEIARGLIPLADTNNPKLTAASTITTGGLGPIRIGMTAQEATKAAGLAIIAPTDSATAASPGCGFARADGFNGVGFMLINGVITRVDVDSGPTATSSGAKIGSTEQEIKDLFPGLITVSPRQNTNGNYLTLTPSSTNLADFRVVFETDGRVVTRYRAGKTPQVEWAEGCA